MAKPAGKRTALVIHQDPGAMDAITRALESHGFEVLAALSAFRAQAYLEGDRVIHVVVAQWEPGHAVGGDVYKWSLARRYDLRSHFVFVGAATPDEFDALVDGRCLAMQIERMPEILAIAEAIVTRSVREQDVSEIAINVEAPSMLLADDDNGLLLTMAKVLKETGYQVTAVDSGNLAIAQLTTQDFDVIVVDWAMGDGNGQDLLTWVRDKRPDLLDRLLFLTSSARPDLIEQQCGRPVFPKGQDATFLTQALEDIVRTVRDEEWR